MPPVGQESAHFTANVYTLTEEMLLERGVALRKVEDAFKQIGSDAVAESVGT